MSERKIYKTMNGKVVDLDQLRLVNELVPAIGNMRVNARGDEISSDGSIVRSREEIVQETIKQEVVKEDVVDTIEEDFGPEISAEEAAELLNKSKKNKPQEK